LLLGLVACTPGSEAPPPPPVGEAGPTAADAAAFVDRANAELLAAWRAESAAAWANATDLTDEHERAASAASAASMATLTRLIDESVPYAAVVGLDDATARQLGLLRLATSLPAPRDPLRRNELADTAARLESMYGKGKSCDASGACRDLGDLEAVLARGGSPEEQLDAWTAWHSVAPPMKPHYERLVTLANEGARDIGYADVGAMWRSGYDMPPDALVNEVDRLWADVLPLYQKLHCHARARLSAKYGPDVVPPTGPIPAHLTGNMWAQSWENLYPLLEPYPDEPSLDVTAGLRAKGVDEVGMVRMAEGFFTSMGLDPLPATFYERSMFVQPEGKEVVCHASAWDVQWNDDLRIKMCIKVDHEDLVTLHHELGHNYYFHYYNSLPPLFRSGANDGFHEGVGDAVALSLTPGHLQKIGLIAEVSADDHGVVNKQMQDALAKIAFLPFGRLVDQWRWDVFAGRVGPEAYTARWWELRRELQGVAAPTPRNDVEHFDPGAKYHIPGNTPYMRYFMAHVLQFQFHEAMCRAAGHQGPLHTCSVYGSEEAGARLAAMLSRGASAPWQDTLEQLTGTRQMDARPLLNYFEPLSKYLDEQNQGRTCGW
jgi:peptidyl-dipeptidase A